MAKKASSQKTGKTKKELLDAAIAEAVGAGKELHLESVDFSDPNRPKTCLEVDFPILSINHVATIEGNAGKPIYQMSKWWARRRSSVFRSMLIAAATKAPDDPAEAAKLVWDSYYGNHQKNEAFKKLKVADIFMGGGTTIVEGCRLGMQMYGNDLNPVAWLVVKNELAQVDAKEVQSVVDAVETEVKPQLTPFFVCDCPRGHKGRWKHKVTAMVLSESSDPLAMSPEQRLEYDYEGPDVIYTFWAKHGPCQATGCGHRTPIFSSPIISVKQLSVKAWQGRNCVACGKTFDVEQKDARMAPAAMQVVGDTESPYAVMDEEGHYACPHCCHKRQDQKAANEGESISLGKAKNKTIDLTLLIHPDWLKGSPGKDINGNSYGGSVSDIDEATAAWNKERAKTAKLIEFRGTLPEQISCPDTGEAFFTDERGGTVPRQAHFTCQACGLEQKVMESVFKTGTHAPISEYALQGYCSQCDIKGIPYGGRFFSTAKHEVYDSAAALWTTLKDSSLSSCWPQDEIPYGNRTHIKDPLPKHGYTHWSHLFNARQLLVHSLLVKSLKRLSATYPSVASYAIGAFQQYLRNQNMFCIWNLQRDTPEPFFSNNNFNPKNRVVENNVFSKLGRGNWQTCVESLFEVLDWRARPWEILPLDLLSQMAPTLAVTLSGKSTKVSPEDPPVPPQSITCGSASDMPHIEDGSLDLVITDPPFGDLIQYAELSDFFYVWLRLVVSDNPAMAPYFASKFTPKALEAVTNDTRHPDNPDDFYKKVLTSCWRSVARKLKCSGLLAFTFHHSEDKPWIAVLESLFEAGLILEATFPIRSDETKGKGEFGSQQIEFDIVHVCRKRLVEPEQISWARLRRQIMKDVRQIQEIIEQHHKEGLGEADLQVIRRGKALEYYSRHHGKVYVEKGREDEFTVKDALVGINQLLDDESDTNNEAPPILAEPYTRQFLRLFCDRNNLERDQLQKHLRGTGVTPSDFLDRGWCYEDKKIISITDPLEWARQWKGKPRKGMCRDFDQSYFLIGACYDDSGIKLSDTLEAENFVPHPAIGDILDWFGKHGGNVEMRSAARRGRQIYSSWLAKNTKRATAQRTLFDLADDEQF